MVAPEKLGGLVHRPLERLRLEAIDVETVVDRHPAAGDLEGAGLAVRDEEDGVAITEGLAGADRRRCQRPRLRRARRRAHQSREQPTKVVAVDRREDPEEHIPLGHAQGGERRRQRSGGLIALERSAGEVFEGRRKASALEPGRARSWSRRAHESAVPWDPHESNHRSGAQPSLTGVAAGV